VPPLEPPLPALVMIDGDFEAEESVAVGLKPPAVAKIHLRMRSVGGRPLPDWLVKNFAVAAVIREESASRPPRIIELSDLASQAEAELFDGVEQVQVQFRLDRRIGRGLTESRRAVAVSEAWAKIAVAPGSRYRLRFQLNRLALDQLERIKNE